MFKKIKVGVGAIIMICAAFISDRAEIILIYALAASIHEAGHLCAAKLLKIPIKEIRFGFSGIRICTDEVVTSYKSEAILALGGPLANLVCLSLSVAFVLIFKVGFGELLMRTDNFLSGNESGFLGALGFFTVSSFLHCTVNLLPINTFDGGRIAYCAVSAFVSERVGERILDISTALSALFIWMVALYLLLKVASGLGVFVFAACIFFSTVVKTEQT